MEKLQVAIATIIVRISWAATVLFPVKKNKITYISYYSNKLTEDFKLISNKLKEKDKYEQVYLLKKFNNTLKDRFFYLMNFVLQTYHINTSRIVVIDANNFVICTCSKKPETKIVQIWHASGAIKKFGYDQSRRYKINNYDYIFVTGHEWIKPFSSAFGVSEEKVIPTGIARTDKLYKNELMQKYKEDMLEEYPDIKDKKVVLYAPTFRGDGGFGATAIKIDLEKIQKRLGDDYVILYKLHPALINESLGQSSRVINVNKKNIYRAFSVVDFLISDYSSIIFDFSILEKPMLFYVPDLEEYRLERGFYHDYERLVPGPLCYREEDIIEYIKKGEFDINKVKDLKNQFFDKCDGKATDRVVQRVEEIIAS